MTQIATTVEQSKKLIKLGIDVNTADMYYYNNDEIPQIVSDIKLLKENINPKFYTPAWSLSALIELMPFPILHNTLSNKWRCTTYHKNGLILKTGEDVDSPLDSVFEMVKYLLENKNPKSEEEQIKELAELKNELFNMK